MNEPWREDEVEGREEDEAAVLGGGGPYSDRAEAERGAVLADGAGGRVGREDGGMAEVGGRCCCCC